MLLRNRKRRTSTALGALASQESDLDMVTDRVISARDVGKTFAEAVREDGAVLGVWSRRHREVFEIWIQTEPIDAAHERALFTTVGTLHEAFPYALIRVHLINPFNSACEDPADPLEDELPSNAEKIYSRLE